MRTMLLQPGDADIRLLRADLVARSTEASEEISECNDYLVESPTKLNHATLGFSSNSRLFGYPAPNRASLPIIRNEH